MDAAIKQRLLAERSTSRRVDALLVVLPSISRAVERALEVHRRAHSNGRGHAQPSLPRMMGPALVEALGRIVGPRWVRHRRAELKTYTMDGLPTRESYPRHGGHAGHGRRGARGRPAAPRGRRAVRRARRRHRALGRRRGRRRSGPPRPHPPEPHPPGRRRPPARRGPARRGERPAVGGGRAARAPLRPRSVEPGGLHRRRQRRRERRRAALPQVRRHHQPHRAARGRAGRRLGRRARLAARRAVGARPRRAVRRQRGHVRDRHRDHRAARADAAQRAHAARRLPHRPGGERGGIRR